MLRLGAGALCLLALLESSSGLIFTYRVNKPPGEPQWEPPKGIRPMMHKDDYEAMMDPDADFADFERSYQYLRPPKPANVTNVSSAGVQTLDYVDLEPQPEESVRFFDLERDARWQFAPCLANWEYFATWERPPDPAHLPSPEEARKMWAPFLDEHPSMEEGLQEYEEMLAQAAVRRGEWEAEESKRIRAEVADMRRAEDWSTDSDQDDDMRMLAGLREADPEQLQAVRQRNRERAARRDVRQRAARQAFLDELESVDDTSSEDMVTGEENRYVEIDGERYIRRSHKKCDWYMWVREKLPFLRLPEFWVPKVRGHKAVHEPLFEAPDFLVQWGRSMEEHFVEALRIGAVLAVCCGLVAGIEGAYILTHGPRRKTPRPVRTTTGLPY